MTPRIHQLPPDIVSKIAAGEVVERPGSAVKELIENSIDAGARSITIDAVEGGRDLIRIVDDGCGIAADQLPLAVASHATSKIASADDLFRVSTLGFRGEALASIAGVSDFRMQSRPVGQEVGARIEVRQGIVGAVQECGCPLGTQIEIRNLFESVPVRRKFLKSKQTELGHITEAVVRVALARPGVAVALRHNERSLYELHAGHDRRDAIRLFYGDEIADGLIPVASEDDGVRVSGFVAQPSVSRPTNRLQYFFVNGRFIRDRSLGHALVESYRGLLLTGRYPVSFLFIEMPADRVDVNVHPTKVEVRFQEPRRIYSQILSTIRERFMESDLSSTFQPSRAQSWQPAVASSAARSAVNEQFALRSDIAAEVQPALWPHPPAARGGGQAIVRDRPQGTGPPSAPDLWAPPSAPAPWAPPSATSPNPTRSIGAQDAEVALADRPARPEVAPRPGFDSADRQSTGPTERIRAIQLHNAYLVVETDEGMLLVDQHALHERILYEEMKERIAGETVEIQELLVPEPVDLTPTQVGLLLEQRSVLAQAGLRIEEFGERTVLVQGYPAMLRRVRPAELVRDLACHLEETGRVASRGQILDDMLHMSACKAAVKAGDPLTAGEIESLVQRRALVDDSHHCPHGRPTVLRFTLGELERQFQRK